MELDTDEVNSGGRRGQALNEYLRKIAFDFILLFPFSLRCFLAIVRRKVYGEAKILTLMKMDKKRTACSLYDSTNA
jgi:hypothetical protein